MIIKRIFLWSIRFFLRYSGIAIRHCYRPLIDRTGVIKRIGAIKRIDVMKRSGAIKRTDVIKGTGAIRKNPQIQ